MIAVVIVMGAIILALIVAIFSDPFEAEKQLHAERRAHADTDSKRRAALDRAEKAEFEARYYRDLGDPFAGQGPHALHLEGGVGLHGPYTTLPELYAAADGIARALPGQLVTVLGPVATLVSPEPTPMWDGRDLVTLLEPLGARS